MNEKDKLKSEEEALRQLLAPLSQSMRDQFFQLWQEYNDGESEEARFVKAVDKMETIIQHNQGQSPADLDYAFNLEYGKKYALHDPVLRLLREKIDGETAANIKKSVTLGYMIVNRPIGEKGGVKIRFGYLAFRFNLHMNLQSPIPAYTVDSEAAFL